MRQFVCFAIQLQGEDMSLNPQHSD